MGAVVEPTLERHGFYPKGGGRVSYSVQPTRRLAPFELLERGPVVRRRARALVSRLPEHVAERELVEVGAALGWDPGELVVETVKSKGPGNALLLEIESEHAFEVVTAFGSKGVPAERVAREACAQASAYLAADVPVGEHLADQLLLLMAIAGRGRFRTLELSSHTLTQIELIPRFLDVHVEQRVLDPKRVEIAISR
jgi:RNA 3'-terminal phosphate cyclase (ATP)